MIQLTTHFSVEEWNRPARHGMAACPYPREWIYLRLQPLALWLEDLREALGKPIRIISGYRDRAYNTRIGGAKLSQHVEGRAADIVVAGIKPQKVHDTALELHESGRRLGGLGLYPGFVHVDTRPGIRLARWTGSRVGS